MTEVEKLAEEEIKLIGEPDRFFEIDFQSLVILERKAFVRGFLKAQETARERRVQEIKNND